MKILLSWTSLSLSLLFFSTNAMANTYGNKDEARSNKGTLVEVASSNSDFSTLVTALKEADLVETLNSSDQFTVFAPTNAAFEKLPEGTLDALLKDKDALKEVLLTHVVPGTVKASTAVTLDDANTANNKTIDLAYVGDTLYVSGAKVTSTDVMASNGVIHVIDNVIVPAGLQIDRN